MASQEMLNALSEEDPSTFRRALNYVKGLRGSGAPLAASANEAMMTALGPQGRKAVAPVAGLANVFSLGADVRDAMEFSGDTLESLKAGDFGKAGSDALYTAAAPFAMLLPGSLGGYKRATDAAVGAVGDTFDTAPTRLQNPQIFAGERAVGAPLDKLDEAKKMSSEGEPDPAIFAATNWRFGDDGKNRFEISDANAFTKPTKKAGTTLLPDVIDHPELFDNYPSLRNVDVKLRSRPGLGSYFSPSENRIYIGSYSVPGELTATEIVKRTNVEIGAINQKIQSLIDKNKQGFIRGSADEAEYVKLATEIAQIQNKAKRSIKGGGKATPDKDVLLHEIQHAIQQRENFARGGSPSQLKGIDRPDNPKWQRWNENKDRVARAVKIRNSQEYKDQLARSNEVFNRDYQPRLNAIELETDKIQEKTLRDKAYQEQTEALFAEARLAHDNQFPLVVEVEEVGRKFGLKEPPRKLSNLETYRNLAGEVEARNVEERMNMTPAERAETFPGLTEDVPVDEQIITRYGRSPMESASPGFDDESFSDMAKRGRIRGARDREKSVKSLADGSSQAQDFQFTLFDEVYESGEFTERLKDMGLTVNDNMMGTVIAGRTQAAVDQMADLQGKISRGESVNAVDLGRLYGYSDEDIAAFYKQRGFTADRFFADISASSGFDDVMESVAESYPIATVGDNMAPPSMYDLPAGSDPRYLGAAPDRNQFSLLRYRPKSETPRVQASIKAISDPENPMRQQLEADIDRGLDVGGADWYNTEELRDWFVKELGEEQGNLEWAQFIDLVGSTSPGSKVPSNIKNASAMRQRLYNDPEYRDLLEGVSNIDEARDIARGRVPGYGHKTQGLQEQILSKQQAGRWSGDPEPGVAPSKGSSTENPKPKGFSWSLKGSSQNIAADLHFTRYVAMASRDPRWLTTQAEIGAADAERLLALSPKKLGKYFGSRKVDGKTLRTFNAKKAVKEGVLDVDQVADLGLPAMWSEKPNTSEYRALEKLMYDIGEQRGLTAPQVQAALWMGAADRTGVDVSSQKTFMEAFRSVADRRAKAESMTREEVIRRFIRDKGLLALPAIGVLGAGAAAVPQDDTDMVSALRGA
tara:strand:- start:1414 stop:4698 length:3285 start_codon:yes stop_codon:yes gene_type:complete